MIVLFHIIINLTIEHSIIFIPVGIETYNQYFDYGFNMYRFIQYYNDMIF